MNRALAVAIVLAALSLAVFYLVNRTTWPFAFRGPSAWFNEGDELTEELTEELADPGLRFWALA